MDATATASKPALAVQLASAFGDLLVAEQTAALNSEIIDATTRTFDRLVRLAPKAKAGASGTALRERPTTLRSLARSTNPSLRVLSHAAQAETVRPPSCQSSSERFSAHSSWGAPPGCSPSVAGVPTEAAPMIWP